MSFQRLFSSVTNICERASKNLICQSQASLHRLDKKFEQYGFTLNPRPMQAISQLRFSRPFTDLPLRLSVLRTKLRKFSKISKPPRTGHIHRQPNFNFKLSSNHNRRAFGEQYVAVKRMDNVLIESGLIQEPVKAVSKVSSGPTGWRVYNLAKVFNRPLDSQFIEKECYEELQQKIQPPIFYGEPSLRTGRVHKSQLIKHLSNRRQHNQLSI